MGAIIMKALYSEDGTPPEAPRKDNGDNYRYEMIFNAGDLRAYGDHLFDLIDCLIPGYAAMGAEARLRARIQYGADLLAPLQAEVNFAFGDVETSPEQRAVLDAPKVGPVEVPEWAGPVPLVLLDAHYLPYTEAQPPLPVQDMGEDEPGSMLFWVRTVQEDEFVFSLARLGVIALREHADFMP